MSFQYFDSHSHLNLSDFESDKEEVIKKMEQGGVGTLTVGTNLETSKEAVRLAKENENLKFDSMMDICGVDYLGQTPRFEVVYHLYSIPLNHRIRIKVRVSEEDCVVPSVISLWKSADWFERETWEMFGVKFEGHPELKPLLLFEGFVGHPLRKDYPIEKRQKIPEPLENL